MVTAFEASCLVQLFEAIEAGCKNCLGMVGDLKAGGAFEASCLVQLFEAIEAGCKNCQKLDLSSRVKRPLFFL